jgi:hypothetical protein
MFVCKQMLLFFSSSLFLVEQMLLFFDVHEKEA